MNRSSDGGSNTRNAEYTQGTPNVNWLTHVQLENEVVVTLEVIKCGKIRVIDSAARCRQNGIPSTQHLAQTNEILCHNGSSKNKHTLTIPKVGLYKSTINNVINL